MISKKYYYILATSFAICILITLFIISPFLKTNIENGRYGDYLLTIKFKKDILSINDTDFNLSMELKNIKNHPIKTSDKFERGHGVILSIKFNESTFFKGPLSDSALIGTEIILNPNDKLFFSYNMYGKRFVNNNFSEPLYLFFPQIGEFEIFVHYDNHAHSNTYKVTII